MSAALRWASLAAGIIFLMGCATHKIDWSARVGSYTYDQAVLEFGPPAAVATLTDGTRVGDWLMARGYSSGYRIFSSVHSVHHVHEPSFPDRYLRLTFEPDGVLRRWQHVSK